MGILRDNPILWREGVPRILRRASPRVHLRLAAGLCLLSIGAAAAAHWFTRNWEDPGLLASLIAVAWAAATVILAPARTARGIVGERRQGTWEAIILTRLRPSEIVMGKLLGALGFFWAMGAFLLPACLALVANTQMVDDLAAARAVVAAAYGAGTVGALCLGAWGLCVSMRVSTVASALVQTFVPGALLCFLAIMIRLSPLLILNRTSALANARVWTYVLTAMPFLPAAAAAMIVVVLVRHLKRAQ